jgi:hypothetical protein
MDKIFIIDDCMNNFTNDEKLCILNDKDQKKLYQITNLGSSLLNIQKYEYNQKPIKIQNIQL